MTTRSLLRFPLYASTALLLPVLSAGAQDSTNAPVSVATNTPVPAGTAASPTPAATSSPAAAPAPQRPPQGGWHRGPGGPGGLERPHGEGGRGGSPLEGQMKTLARGMKQLSVQITDPAKQAENVAAIEGMIKAANDSKNFSPRLVAEAPQAEQAGLTEKYKTDLTELAEALAKVEKAVQAGDYAGAKSLLGTVNTIKKEGHSQFSKD